MISFAPPKRTSVATENSFRSTSGPVMMGIVNVTPDSFSDGMTEGLSVSSVVATARAHAAERVHILDLGAESTRPGFVAVPWQEELRRLQPAFEAIRAACPDLLISIDTSKGQVAAPLLAMGAAIINDVSCGQDERLVAAVAGYDAELVLMHGRHQAFDRERPGKSIADALEQAMAKVIAAGVSEYRITLDPGIGFGKAGDDNFLVLNDLAPLRTLGRPVLVGLSRKGFLSHERSPRDRTVETTAACALAVAKGADALRVHDIEACRRAAVLGWKTRVSREKAEG